MLQNLLTYAVDTAEPIVKWLTIAVLAAVLFVGFVLFFAKKQAVGTYAKYSLFGVALYSLIIALVMLGLNIAKHFDKNYLEDKWVSTDIIYYVFLPLFCVCALLLVAGIILFTLSTLKVNKKAFKITSISFASLSVAGIISTIVTASIYYFKHIYEDGYYNSETSSVNQIALYVAAGVLVVVTLIVALWLGKKDNTAFDSRCISLAGICIAMSFALSYIKLWEMPQGGSITLVSLLPIMLFAYAYGVKKGLLAGFIYGILQAVQDPYIIHPAQFLLDYPIAFAMVGFAGLFAGAKFIKQPQIRFLLGATIAAILRYVCHVLSGVFAFSAYAGEVNPWIYSLAYNSFVFVDILLVLVAGVFVFSSHSFVKQVESYPLKSQMK